MIDITAPKVLIPTTLFILLSPWMGNVTRPDIVRRAMVLLLLYRMGTYLKGLTITRGDLLTATALFIVLTPGIFVTLPPGTRGPFVSGQTSWEALGVHAMVFAVVFAFVRKSFPGYY